VYTERQRAYNSSICCQYIYGGQKAFKATIKKSLYEIFSGGHLENMQINPIPGVR